MEVVDFFCEHHSEDAIEKDINNGYVSVLKIDGDIVATGCFVDNHITRVYVLPEHQKKGYGTFIMKNIEEQIGEKFDKAYLDAWCPELVITKALGMRSFWDMQQNQEIHKNADWQDKMVEIEMRVSDMGGYKDIAFFHHLMIEKR